MQAAEPNAFLFFNHIKLKKSVVSLVGFYRMILHLKNYFGLHASKLALKMYNCLRVFSQDQGRYSNPIKTEVDTKQNVFITILFFA